jgi:hypothetical protein
MSNQTGFVSARERWNRVADVEKDVEYEVTVPAGEEWKDAWIRCGPEGYTSSWLKPFERLRRHPPSRWFALIGAIGDSEPFLIGRKRVVRPTEAGELRCFANDVPFMYWNNSGAIRVVVARQSGNG